MALDNPQSIFRRSLIFKRFSKQDKKPCADTPYTPSSSDFRPRSKQRRHSSIEIRTLTPTTTTITHPPPSAPETKYQPPKMFTHIQRIDIKPTPRPETSPLTNFHAQKVSPNALPTSPFPPSYAITTVPWNISLPPTQIFALYRGFMPRDMRDKWFIYSEGPDPSGKLKVHFHQRWTGVKMAELFVVMDLKGDGAGKIVGIKWDAGEDGTQMGEEEAKYLVKASCKWALRIELEERRGEID